MSVVSIYSNTKNLQQKDRVSVNEKITKIPPVQPAGPVTVTVDGFGTLVSAVKLPSSRPGGDAESDGEENNEEADDDYWPEEEGGGGEDVDTKKRSSQSEPLRQTVNRYTFRNQNRMTVQVITYGATITAMHVPDKYGNPEDLVMGFDDLRGYVEASNLKFGCSIGRCCNRISDGRYCLNGSTIQLSQNDKTGKHHIDGGWLGFDQCLWTPHLNKNVLTLTHVSEFGTEGYPGSVMARATYELKNDNTFHVSYAATTSWPTPINLCNNLYFNLAGHGAGHSELYKHVVTLNADRTVRTDEDRVPTGVLQCVGGTINDLRVPHELGPAISRCPGGGYDEYMCLIQGTEQDLTFGGRVVHPNSGRVLEVYTDQPGLRFYTGNELPDPFDDINPTEVYTQDYFEIPSTTIGRLKSVTRSAIAGVRCPTDSESGGGLSLLEGVTNMAGNPDEEEYMCGEGEEEQSCHCSESPQCTCTDVAEPIVGKHGATYQRHGAFCMNTQMYPDAVNVTNFPNVILYPGQMYKHEIVYKFGLFMGGYKKPAPPVEEVNEEVEDELIDVE